MTGIKKLQATALAVATSVVTPAGAQTGDGYYYDHGMMWNGGWSGMFFGGLMMLVFFGAVIILVAFSVRWLTGMASHQSHSDTGPKPDKALDILKERYARGEIGEEEFQDKKKHLSD